MQNTIQVGRRIVPIEQIALIEPFDRETQKNMRSDRTFRSRIVLLNRDSVLSESDSLALAEEHAFRILLKDNVATNPAVSFSVETFEPTASLQPSKPFASRLMWRDERGDVQSKLLLTEVEDLIATVVRGAPSQIDQADQRPVRLPRRRRRATPATAPQT
ncbi:hypothetical protein CVM73_18870 [Bradyrhizobium forestalis]|uniref:Uncharacterized protein n=1 Tax=Bradyrhizobium forestalis TaxID=1419263 RepID=A0A2M8R7I4_9BRAD|nr:hypothetical protein [Bradyrhizobium forestalis]PJG53784.1 hypothetical protein CVM73_18870 [Bradyrhizobium forestalis]